jgi:hypothetical protein
MMLKIITILVAIFICSISVCQGERLAPLGIEIPVPVHDNWILPEDTIRIAPGVVEYDLLLFLSRDGCVDSISFHSVHRDYVIESIMPSLSSLDFEPAVYAEDSTPFILPGELLFFMKDGLSVVELALPIEANSGAVNRELTRKAMELNGFELPEVLEVPSYYCLFKDRSDPDFFPYAIFKVNLDSGGVLTDLSMVKTNYEQMAEIMHSVLLYSEFKGASYLGENIPSQLYITIRFFTALGYPVPVWPSATKPGLSDLLGHCRIDYLPYRDSLISPAIPLNVDQGYFIGQKRILNKDTLTVDVVIDKEGRIESARLWNIVRRNVKNSVLESLKSLQFLPARDINVSAVSFEGRIIIVPNYSKKLRIMANWLPRRYQTFSD